MIIVTDTFNRPDDLTSMGVADTGQAWQQVPGEGNVSPGDPFGILSGEAFWNRNGTGALGDSLVVVETGFRNTKGRVRLMDVTAGGGLNLRNQGVLIRYVDTTHYIFCAYFTASGSTGFRVYIADGGAPQARGFGADGLVMVNGDYIGWACCDQTIQWFHNDVLACEGFVGSLLSATLLGGTKVGLMASGGILSTPPYQRFADFSAETNEDCEEGLIFLPPLEVSGVGEVGSGGGDQPEIVPCSPSEPPVNPVSRIQRVLNFTQEIHRNLQLQISSVAPLTLYGYSMEHIPVSISELRNQRNAYASTFQFSEYGSFFQAYICYSSTTDIVWSIVGDGGTLDTYTLPSTAGVFVKRWVVLRARKCKLFDWSFSSEAEFQIISSQSVLLAKEYKSSGAYQPLNCFGDQTV